MLYNISYCKIIEDAISSQTKAGNGIGIEMAYILELLKICFNVNVIKCYIF